MATSVSTAASIRLPSIEVDIVVIGAGLAGTLAAILLGRAGFYVALVDRNDNYPPDFRAEQLVGYQVDMLVKLGLFDAVAGDTAPAERAVAMRGGRCSGTVRVPHYGISYETMVNRARGHLPPSVQLVIGKVVDIEATPDRQFATTSDGRRIDARLVVMATGLGHHLLRRAGIGKTTMHDAHVLAYGFDVECTKAQFFEASVLVVPGEQPVEKIDYLTLFAVGEKVRGNLFTYHDINDPCVQSLRRQPMETLRCMMPWLEDVTGTIKVVKPVEIRVIDLAVASDYRRDGIVLVGDAFQTSSPAAGTGVSRLLNDIDLLCNKHVPDWFATGGMSASKIDRFYDDPVKQGYDKEALRVAGYRRAVTVETGLRWRVHRRRVALQNQVRAVVAERLISQRAGLGGMLARWASSSMAPPPLG